VASENMQCRSPDRIYRKLIGAEAVSKGLVGSVYLRVRRWGSFGR
jgi:hypothetical protein